jgi:UDP-N-acetylglucosamine 3-dehydrogenase
VSEPTLRVALAGAGAIAVEGHLPAWQAQPGATVTCVADSQPERAATVADAWQVPTWCTDWRELVERDDFDAVDLCLPARLHAPAAIAFLQAGKHVLLEKPFVTSLQEAAALLAAEQASQRVLMIAENWPFASAVRRVERLLSSGALGEIYMLRAHHESRLYAPDARGKLPDRVQARDAVGGNTMSAGIHSINLAAALMGGFESVFAYALGDPAGPQPWVDSDVAIAARFGRGGIGVMNFTGRSAHIGERRLAFALFGTDGVVEFDVLSGQVTSTVAGVRTSVRDAAPSMGYAEEIAHFHGCVTRGGIPLVTAGQQAHTLATVLATYQSIHARQEVRPAALLAEAGLPATTPSLAGP